MVYRTTRIPRGGGSIYANRAVRRMKAGRPEWAARRISIRPRQHQPPVSSSTNGSMSKALTSPSPLMSPFMMSQFG
jgi:hypothetical protein